MKRLPTEKGWSLEMLANASGVSRSMLSQIERQKSVLYRSVFDVVTELLELELEDYSKTLIRPAFRRLETHLLLRNRNRRTL